MALQKQLIPLNFAVGMDTKPDVKQLGTDNLYNIENAVFTTMNSFQKRNGYTSLTNELLDGTRYTNPKSASFYNSEIQLFTDRLLHTYSSTAQKWTTKGNVSNTKVSSYPILRNNYAQTEIQCAIVENIACYYWKDSKGGTRCSVIDRETNTSFLYDVEISATGTNPKLEALDNLFFLFYVDGVELKYKTINSANASSVGLEQILIDTLQASKMYDVKSINRRIFIAYDSTLSGGSVSLFTLESDGTTSSELSAAGESAENCINLNKDAQSRVLISYANSTEVKFFNYTYFLSASPITPTVIETIADCTNISVIQKNSTTYQFAYEISSSPSSNYYIKKNTLTTAAVVGTPSIVSRSIGLASEQFIYNNTIYFLTVHDSQLQATYFLMSEDGLIISKISPGLGGDVIPAGSIPKVRTLDNINFLIPSQIKGTGVTQQNPLITYYLLGVNSSNFLFEPAQNYQNTILGKNLYTTGGVLLNYDGYTITEDNFHLGPENAALQSSSNSGGSISNGTRQYIFVYMWTDNRGQINRSTPSIPFTYVNSGGSGNQSNVLRVPTLRLTSKTDVIIEGYRTENNGTTFYKFTPTTGPNYNSKTVDFIDITDTISDSTLLGNEILYTTGGILDNVAAPVGTAIATYGNRIIIMGLEDGNRFAYSKIREEGKPTEFSDALNGFVDDDNGTIIGGIQIDNNFLFFKPSSIYAISGQGPNNAGGSNDFGQPQKIVSDVGLESPDSLVVTDVGVMFKSKKGIYLIDRGLSVSYIGYPVERFNNEKITSAVLVPLTNQVRFTTAKDTTLVYDYFVKRWCIFTNHGALDAYNNINTYSYLNTNTGRIWIETPGQFRDNGEPILLTFESGWISFTGLQGFARVYKMMVLGDFKSDHKLRISAAYDFTQAYIHDRVIDSSEIVSNATYGSDPTYGSSSPYGGGENQYQFRFDFKRQKCESIRLKFEELQNMVQGEGLSLSGITFEVAGKFGMYKANQSKIFGAK